MASAERENDHRAPSEAVFKHARLTDNHSQIRLLHIQSQLEDDGIRCSIEHFALDSLPPYVALSYRWDTTRDRIPVRIGRQGFQAVPNAWLALQYLGLKVGAYIWIDSICIDQGDVTERNAQVGLMSTIYSSAAEVYVWLGLETQQSEAAFEALQSALKFQAKDIDSESMRQYCLALQHLFKNEYWSRTWIVQEVIFAQRLTIAAGQLRVTWDFLETFFTRVLPLWESSLSHLPEKGLDALLSSIGDASARTLVKSRIEYHHKLGWVRCRNSELFDFLQEHRNSKCLDPRDKIYGLLGLFNKIAFNPMNIDYSKTAKDLLMYSLSYILEGKDASRFLDVAELLAHLLGVRTVETVFQTWLRSRPEFHVEGPRAYFQCRLSTGETICLPLAEVLCQEVCPVPNKKMLGLRNISSKGIRFWIAPHNRHDDKPADIADWLVRHYSLICSLVKVAPTSACIGLDRAALSAWSGEEGKMSSMHSEILPQGFGRLVRPQPITKYISKACMTSVSVQQGVCESPKAFIDEEGNLGIVCSKARVGDVICEIVSTKQLSIYLSPTSTTSGPTLPPGSETQSRIWGHLNCVLRPSTTLGYELIGSALLWRRAVSVQTIPRYIPYQEGHPEHVSGSDSVSGSESEHNVAAETYKTLYLDPPNVLALLASTGWPEEPVERD